MEAVSLARHLSEYTWLLHNLPRQMQGYSLVVIDGGLQTGSPSTLLLPPASTAGVLGVEFCPGVVVVV